MKNSFFNSFPMNGKSISINLLSQGAQFYIFFLPNSQNFITDLFWRGTAVLALFQLGQGTGWSLVAGHNIPGFLGHIALAPAHAVEVEDIAGGQLQQTAIISVVPVPAQRPGIDHPRLVYPVEIEIKTPPRDQKIVLIQKKLPGM